MRAAALLSATGAVVGAASLLFAVEVARIGGASAYGGVGALLSLATLATFVASGIQYAVARGAVHDQSSTAVLRRGVRATAPWLALAAVALPGAPAFAAYLNLGSVAPVLLTDALFAVIVVGAVPAGVLIGRRRFGVVAAGNLAGAAVRLLVGAVLPRVEGAVDGALVASLLGSLAIIAVQVVALSRDDGAARHHGGAVSQPAAGMAVEGLVGAILTSALWAIWNLPVVFARHWLDDVDAGRFAVAQQLTTAVLFLAVPIATAFFPTLVRHRDARVAGTGLGVTLVVSAATAAVLATLGPVLIPHVYGPSFSLPGDLLAVQGAGACAVVTVSYALWATRATSRHTGAVAVGIVVALAAETLIAAALHDDMIRLAVGPVIALAVGMCVAAAGTAVGRRRPPLSEPAPGDGVRGRRILVLNWKDPSDPAAGGAETYVRRIAETWAARGNQVTLLVPRAKGRPRQEVVDGVRHLRMGTRLTVFHHSRRHLRRHGREYDCVVESISTRPFHAHRLLPGRSTALYHQIADEVWEEEFAFPLSWLGRRVIEPRWVAGMRDARVVAVSRSTAADLELRGVATAAVVHPGCDAPRGPERVAPGTPPRLVFLGRLCRTKRPQEAIRALAVIQRALPGATLDVIGDGYLLDELRRVPVPGVRLQGFVDEATKLHLLRSADLLLMPATREGWGIVTVEAAMQGVPTVGYDVPGVRESVVDGVTGVLTAPEPEALGAAAAALLQDPERWRRLSRSAQERAALLTWERTASEVLAAATTRPQGVPELEWSSAGQSMS